MRIARGIFSRYNNLIFAVLEVCGGDSIELWNLEEVFASIFAVL